jgi:hypothetical protein
MFSHDVVTIIRDVGPRNGDALLGVSLLLTFLYTQEF